MHLSMSLSDNSFFNQWTKEKLLNSTLYQPRRVYWIWKTRKWPRWIELIYLHIISIVDKVDLNQNNNNLINYGLRHPNSWFLLLETIVESIFKSSNKLLRSCQLLKNFKCWVGKVDLDRNNKTTYLRIRRWHQKKE